MSINTNRSFSHSVSEHRFKASGFTEEDIIHETFHNSLDAEANIINYEFISNKDDKYLLIIDNGKGCDNLSQFFAMGNSIIRKRFAIGCKNIGFLGSISVIEPEEVLILSKISTSNNKKTIKYFSRAHYEILNEIDKINNDYRRIDDTKYFETDILGDIDNILINNEKYITSNSFELYKNINKKEGTLIILKLSNTSFETLCNITIDDNIFMNKIIFMSKEIDKINFYKNKENKKPSKYIDILNNDYKPLIFEIKFIECNGKKYFEENIYINDKKKDNLIARNYLLAMSNGIKLLDNFNETKQVINTIGSFICKYQFLNQVYWDNLGKPLDAGIKRSLIYDFYNSKYRIFSDSNSTSGDPLYRNGGPFLFSIYLDENNMSFAEKYLGIKMNKRLTTADSFQSEFKYYIIGRLKKLLVSNISHYKKYGDFGRFLNKDEYKAEGIKDWKNFSDYIIDLFEGRDINNILIEEYKDRHPNPPEPKPLASKLIAPKPPAPKPPAPKQPEPKQPESKQSAPKPITPHAPNPNALKQTTPNTPAPNTPAPKPPMSLVPKLIKIDYDYDIYNGLVYFYINNMNDFDEISIKYRHISTGNDIIKKFYKDELMINELNPERDYHFIIESKNPNLIQHVDVIRPNFRETPMKPIFSIDDKTHDIKILFKDIKDIGIKIKKVKIFIDNKMTSFEDILFNNEITMTKKIHKLTDLEIQFEDEFGKIGPKSDKIKIKEKECIRQGFSAETKNQALEKSRHKCSITGISFTSDTRIEYDHLNNISCDNSIDNCQPLLPEIHCIKTYDESLFKELKEKPNELLKYKIKRINGILDSLSIEEKKSLNFNNNILDNIMSFRIN